MYIWTADEKLGWVYACQSIRGVVNLHWHCVKQVSCLNNWRKFHFFQRLNSLKPKLFGGGCWQVEVRVKKTWASALVELMTRKATLHGTNKHLGSYNNPFKVAFFFFLILAWQLNLRYFETAMTSNGELHKNDQVSTAGQHISYWKKQKKQKTKICVTCQGNVSEHIILSEQQYFQFFWGEVQKICQFAIVSQILNNTPLMWLVDYDWMLALKTGCLWNNGEGWSTTYWQILTPSRKSYFIFFPSIRSRQQNDLVDSTPRIGNLISRVLPWCKE